MKDPKKYINAIESKNRSLTIILIFTIILLVISILIRFVMRIEITQLEKENSKLEQQVKDYSWQLERVEYIIKCKGEE